VQERFWMRERPNLSYEASVAELRALLSGPGVTIDLSIPEWAQHHGLARRTKADEYISVHEELLFPVANSTLKTCLSQRYVGAQIRTIE
jgi:hypothetical protein